MVSVVLPADVRDRTVPAMLERTVARRGDVTALVAPGLGEAEGALTYAEVASMRARLARTLAGHGVGHGDKVCLLLDQSESLEAHLTYHASHLLGAINVALNTRYVERELDYTLRFAAPAAIVCSSRFAPFAAHLRHERGSRVLIVAGDGAPEAGGVAFAEALDTEPLAGPAEVEEHHDADWIFTSGTTGNPKAVALTHANSVACGHQARHLWGLEADSVYQSFAPFFTSTGCHTNLLPTILTGCTYVIEPEFDARATLERAVRHGTTSIFLISGVIQLILDRIQPADLDELLESSSLRRIAYGGQPMGAGFFRRALEVFEERHGLDMVHLWGLTEGGTAGTFLDPELHREGVERAGRHGLSIGTHGFSDWVRVRVLDDDDEPTAPGEVGELCMQAPSVMNRYVREEEATRAALAGGWLHTGDMASVDPDGFIYFVDRRKAMIRRGGLNVSSAEVEGVICEHPAVAEAAVVPKPNPVLEEEVRAVVVLHPGAELTPEELVEHCRGLLADYKVPVEVEFRAELPKNAMGRVVKGALTGEGSALAT